MERPKESGIGKPHGRERRPLGGATFEGHWEMRGVCHERKIRYDTDVRGARQVPERLFDARDELDLRAILCVRVFWQRELHCHRVRRVEAGIDAKRGRVRACDERRACDEDNGERDLRDQKHTGCPDGRRYTSIRPRWTVGSCAQEQPHRGRTNDDHGHEGHDESCRNRSRAEMDGIEPGHAAISK